MKKTTFFTLTDSSYHVSLRNRLLDTNKSVVVSLLSIRRTAVNHFESIKYKNNQQSSDGSGSRRSLRFIGHASTQLNVTTPKKIHFNVESRKL